MNKGELVEKVAKDCDMSKTDADKILSTILGAIIGAITAGDKVTLVGFGTFSVGARPARDGRNPKTGETIKIPSRITVRFKAGSKLLESVNC